MGSASRRWSFFVGRVDFGCGAYQGGLVFAGFLQRYQATGPGESMVRIIDSSESRRQHKSSRNAQLKYSGWKRQARCSLFTPPSWRVFISAVSGLVSLLHLPYRLDIMIIYSIARRVIIRSIIAC